MKNEISALWKAVCKVLVKRPGQIFATHLSYLALGVLLFSPLAGILGQFVLSLSGKSVLSDLDILYFFLTPMGMLGIILLSALAVTILIFEQASLMAVCLAGLEDRRITLISALYFTAARAKNIFLFALNLVIRVLLISFPFIAIAFAIAFALITEYDINYYLTEKPPAFLLAAATMGLVMIAMLCVLIRSLLAWSFTLPLILFGRVRPHQAFKHSEKLTKGHKPVLLTSLGIWALASSLMGALIFGGIQLLGSALSPLFVDSMTWLIPALGGIVALWTLANVLVTTLTAAGFVTLVVTAYIRAGGEIGAHNFLKSVPKKNKQVTAPLFCFLLVAGAGVAVFVGNWLLDDIPTKEDIHVIAHRGAAGRAPENTMASIDRAIKDKSDWIEIDVQESRDGEVVVIHDKDFMKLANVNKKVWESSFAQIQNMDVGRWFGPDFAGEKVPTLEQVLEAAKGKSRVLIELKYYGHDEQLEQRVAKIVEQAGMKDEVAIMSLEYKGIQKFRALRPGWPVGLLSSKSLGDLSGLDVEFLALNMATATPGLIRRIQSTGKQVFVWTVNDQLSMLRMISLGVDGLITDEPALAVDVLEEHAGLMPVERLLVHTSLLLNRSIPKGSYRDQSP
jgi:glycerophosphoryl diester phosphodiesterase